MPPRRRAAPPIPVNLQRAQVPDATWQPCPEDARVIWFPWDSVVSDNEHYVPARGRRGLTLSRAYREAKKQLVLLASMQWGPLELFRGPISLTARCYFPDEKVRDAGNYRKAITDSLSGICYRDDSQLVCETWRFAGIDRERPRIEIKLESDRGEA